jgi:PEP-CTERM motif-containing protein
MLRAHLNPSGKHYRIGLVVCVLTALAVTPAWATNCSYSISISEDLGRLDPSVPAINSTTSAEWIYLRNNPYFEITNTSDPASGASITSLTVQLNNPTQNMSIIQTGIDSVGGVATLIPTLASLPTTASSSITLNFTSFDPGDSIIFRVHLVPRTSKDSKFADYRPTFFTFSNDVTPNPKNASSTVQFHTSDPSDPNPVAGPNLWKNLPASLAGTTSFGVAYACLNSPDAVINIPASTGSNPQVPEPSSLLLAGLGLAGVYLGRSRLGLKRK